MANHLKLTCALYALMEYPILNYHIKYTTTIPIASNIRLIIQISIFVCVIASMVRTLVLETANLHTDITYGFHRV